MKNTPADTNTDIAVEMARGHIYTFFASALADPLGSHFQKALDKKVQVVAVAAARLLASEALDNMEITDKELSPANLDLTIVINEINFPHGKIIEQYQNLFGLVVGKTAPPYETEYCHTTETFYRTQHLADVAGFYAAFGFRMNSKNPERQDHISVELEFMSRLIERGLHADTQDRVEICLDAQKKFIADHIAWWIPGFTLLVRNKVPDGLYASLACALASFIPFERSLFAIGPTQVFAHIQPEPDLEACITCIQH